MLIKNDDEMDIITKVYKRIRKIEKNTLKIENLNLTANRYIRIISKIYSRCLKLNIKDNIVIEEYFKSSISKKNQDIYTKLEEVSCGELNNALSIIKSKI